jgi:predicted transcriptional regulator
MTKAIRKPSTFQEFEEFGLAAVRRARQIDPKEPKIWVERTDASDKARVRFESSEAGAKLLSVKNRKLLRIIAERRPKSVSELAMLAHRARQNLLRTLHKLSAAGLVRLDEGDGGGYRPVVTARKVHFEIDLLA